MTLRLRMTLVLVAIVAVGLLAADVVTYTALRSFLTSRVDSELTASVTPIGRALVNSVYPSGFLPGEGDRSAFVPPGTFAELRDPSGTVLVSPGLAYGPQPNLPSTLPGSGATANGPVFFNASSPGPSPVSYRVVAEGVDVNGVAFGTVVVAIPLTEAHQTLRQLLAVEALVTALLLSGLGAGRLVDRPARAAAPRRHGHDGRGDRGGRPQPAGVAGGRCHRGRTARARPQHHAGRDRGGLRRPHRLRGAPAPVPGRRLARIAHAAHVDPRVRRDLRPGSAGPPCGPGHIDAPHPLGSRPDERARRRPAPPRPPRPRAPGRARARWSCAP